MSGKAFLLVGATGTGKTTFLKRCLDKVNKSALFIYDVNGEYKDYFNEPFDDDIERWLIKANAIQGGIIAIEEATISFSNRSSSDSLRKLLVRKRHTNNTVFLVFHSLRNIPRFVYDLSTNVILHKTNDSETLVFDKFKDERLTKVFLSVQNNPSPHYAENFSIY